MVFIKDLELASELTPKFADAFENFFPVWLNMIVPHYQEAKMNGIELLELRNVMYLGENHNTCYEKNGFGYIIQDVKGFGKILGFDARFNGSAPNWHVVFSSIYNEFEEDDMQRTNNFIYYNPYMSRTPSKKPPYDVIQNRVNEYFRTITDDKDVFFSLGNTSFVCLSEKAVRYVDIYTTGTQTT